jgi:hypothetical protein
LNGEAADAAGRMPLLSCWVRQRATSRQCIESPCSFSHR